MFIKVFTTKCIFHCNENDFSILAAITQDGIDCMVCGVMPNPEIFTSYYLSGDWITHEKYGEEFKFSTSIKIEESLEEFVNDVIARNPTIEIGPERKEDQKEDQKEPNSSDSSSPLKSKRPKVIVNTDLFVKFSLCAASRKANPRTLITDYMKSVIDGYENIIG